MKNKWESIIIRNNILILLIICNLPQRNIQHHHQGKAQGKADCADVGFFLAGGFGEEFFYDYVDHGAGGEG